MYMTTVRRGRLWKGDTQGRGVVSVLGSVTSALHPTLSAHHGMRPYCSCALRPTEKPALPLPLAASRAGDARQGSGLRAESPGHFQMASGQPCPGSPGTPAQGPDCVSRLFRSRSDQTHQRGDACVAVDKG